MDDKQSLRGAFPCECLQKGHIVTLMRRVVEMHGVNPVGMLAYGKLEGVLAVGNGINFAFLKAEDVRTVLSVGRQTSNDRA
jgi:hypothetical protein